MDIETGVTQQKILECAKNLTVIKIISISYPLLKQFVMSMKGFDKTLICEKARNRQIFLTILRRQGPAFRGNNNEGNLEQLMKLSAKVDPRITSWMEKKR